MTYLAFLLLLGCYEAERHELLVPDIDPVIKGQGLAVSVLQRRLLVQQRACKHTPLQNVS